MPETPATADGNQYGIRGKAAAAPQHQRPKPGERRVQILQALAGMLEQPGGERITTAALAAKLQVSEAALYRHFASKAQMFEALIDFIEQSVFTLINQISAGNNDSGRHQAAQMVTMLLRFCEKNPGMTRVMVGDALVLEHVRLLERINLFFDKFEAALKQCLRLDDITGDSLTPSVDLATRTAVLGAFSLGRMQRYARSNFKRRPTEQLDACLLLLLSR
ncbi:MAG: nucleoid occlusion factor SlmA [Comamonadaceae bacterium]|nr:nucleoid occlusion factor SlmA [Comamonadaceae bacterium]